MKEIKVPFLDFIKINTILKAHNNDTVEFVIKFNIENSMTEIK